jgi:hypothetical protein
MRKTLTLFLAVQALSFVIWITMPKDTNVMAKEPAEAIHAVSGDLPGDKNKAEIHPDFEVRNFDTSEENINTALKDNISKALNKLPAEHAKTVRNIILDFSPAANRGLGGNNLIILRSVGMGANELIGVLVHEIGHNVDYGYLTDKNTDKRSGFMDGNSPVYITDPSVDFYRICWDNESKLKKTANNFDFVSGYAMADPFEDFAETYTYYVLHGNDFRALTSANPNIYAKYRFMKYRVFNGVEFDTDDGRVKPDNRPWDTTLLSYDLDKFLAG